MKTGTIFAIEHPDFGMKFIGYTEGDLNSRLGQLRAQKGRDPILLWIQSLDEDRWRLTIRPLLQDCPYEERRERVRGFVLEHAAAGAQLLNDRCNKRVHRGTGSPIASEPTYIYCLRHPLTREVRYVGKTVDLKEREKGHRQLGKTRCDNWKRALMKEDLWPEMEVLETVSVGTNWVEREQHWIAHFRSLGANLTNLTDGGEGTHGRVVTEAYREKLRKAFTGRPIPLQQREQISKTLTGKIQSPETVAKRLQTWAERRIAAGLRPLGEGDAAYNDFRRNRRHTQGGFVKGSDELKQHLAERQRAYYDSLTNDQKKEFAEKHKPTLDVARSKRTFRPMTSEERQAQSVRLKAYIATLTSEQRQARTAASRAAMKARMEATP